MNFYLLAILIAGPVTLGCMVIAGIFLKAEGWWRPAALLMAMGALSIIAVLNLPGWFEDGEDIANGLLFVMWLFQSFWFSVTAAIWLLVLERPVNWILGKIRAAHGPAIEETFE